MFYLVSANWRDSIAMQQYLLGQLEQVRTAVPGFIQESFQNYYTAHFLWRRKVEQAITELMQVL